MNMSNLNKSNNTQITKNFIITFIFYHFFYLYNTPGNQNFRGCCTYIRFLFTFRTPQLYKTSVQCWYSSMNEKYEFVKITFADNSFIYWNEMKLVKQRFPVKLWKMQFYSKTALFMECEILELRVNANSIPNFLYWVNALVVNNTGWLKMKYRNWMIKR